MIRQWYETPRQALLAGDGCVTPGAGTVLLHRRVVCDRPASGRQPGLRSRRQPVCDLQRHTRSGSAGLDLPRASQRDAGDVLVRHREPHIDGDRSRGPSLRLQPLRGDGLPRLARRLGGALCQRSRRRLWSGVRAGRDAVCRRSLRHDLQGRSRRACARRSRRLPPSVAAFHLALAPDGALHVSAPTLSTYDAIYRIAPDGTVGVRDERFGRPQGIAFDAHGTLFVVEALAGSSGLYRLSPDGRAGARARGPQSHRRRLRSARRLRRVLQRHGVSAVAVRLNRTRRSTTEVCRVRRAAQRFGLTRVLHRSETQPLETSDFRLQDLDRSPLFLNP